MSMLIMFTKSPMIIIASDAYISTYMLLCLLYLYCPIMQGVGHVWLNAMHDHEVY